MSEGKGIWGKVAGLIGGAAPMVGQLLMGPAGNSIGSMVASVLGVAPTPDAVAQAIQADPEAAVKIARIESEERVRLQELLTQQSANELQAESANLATVNTTMQAEAQSEKWLQYSWRPIFGLTLAAAFMTVVVFCCVLAWRAISKADADAMSMIPSLISSFMPMFGFGATIVGVAAWHRGKEKRVRAGEAPVPGLLRELSSKT